MSKILHCHPTRLLPKITGSNQNGNIIKLGTTEISKDIIEKQVSLTDLWDNAPNFAVMMGYKGKKTYIFNSIVMDALRAFKSGTEIHYSRNKNGYNGVGHLKYYTTTKAISFLAEKGYVWDFHAPASGYEKNAIRSFFKPTEALYAGFGRKLEGWHERIKPIPFSVEMTISKEEETFLMVFIKPRYRKIADREIFKETNNDLYAQNCYLSEQQIDFCPPTETSRWGSQVEYAHYSITKNASVSRVIDTSHIWQKRVFLKKRSSDVTYFTGRFYGGFWQSIGQSDRSHLKINMETVGKELDYSALHPTLAYCLADKTMPQDVYACDFVGSENFGSAKSWRKVCKRALLIAINASTFKSAKGALANYLLESFPALYPAVIEDSDGAKQRRPARRDAKKILDAVIDCNSDIRDFIHSDYGIKLQRIDADIMAQVQKRNRALDIPILGVHDSILFPDSRTADVSSIFYEELELAKSKLRKQGLGAYGMT